MDQLWVIFEIEIGLSVEQVWGYLVDPNFRSVLVGADRIEVANRSQGRITQGSVYQCYHGDKQIPQTILEWVPFERMIVKEMSPVIKDLGSINEYKLARTDAGTLFAKTLTAPTGPLYGRILMQLMTPMLRSFMRKSLSAFKQEIEAENRRNRAGLRAAKVSIEEGTSDAGEAD